LANRRGNKSTWLIVLLVVAILIGLPVCLCGSFIAVTYLGITGMIQGSEPFQQGLAKAQANPDVIARLGEPIEASVMTTGNIRLDNDRGECDLSVPISGPQGSGTLIIRGTRQGGQWTYQELKVQVGTEVITLNDSPPVD
jgi:hypothetical protein